MPPPRRSAAVIAAFRAIDVELSERRLRIVLAVLFALSATFVALCVQSVVTATPPYKFNDFQALWTSGVLAHDGEPTANYNSETLHLRLVALGMSADEHGPFPYPPIFLLILAPLGGLNRAAAYDVFIGASFVLYLWTSIGGRWRAWPHLVGALAAPATGVNFIFGQSGFLASGLMLGGLNFAERRPIVAGALFGLLAFKPQLGRWRRSRWSRRGCGERSPPPVRRSSSAPPQRPPPSARTSGGCGFPRSSTIRGRR